MRQLKVDIVVSSGKTTKDNVLNLTSYSEADSVTKNYTINEPDKNYLLMVTKNTENGETKLYEKLWLQVAGS